MYSMYIAKDDPDLFQHAEQNRSIWPREKLLRMQIGKNNPGMLCKPCRAGVPELFEYLELRAECKNALDFLRTGQTSNAQLV